MQRRVIRPRSVIVANKDRRCGWELPERRQYGAMPMAVDDVRGELQPAGIRHNRHATQPEFVCIWTIPGHKKRGLVTTPNQFEREIKYIGFRARALHQALIRDQNAHG